MGNMAPQDPDKGHQPAERSTEVNGPSHEEHSLVADAIDRISTAYSQNPTEDTMNEAVGRELTGREEVDALIIGYATDTLLLSRTKGASQ